jgi:hypothetical protein
MASKERRQPEKQNEGAGNEFIRRFKANPFIFIGTVVVLVIVIVAFVFVPAIVPTAESGQIDLNFGFYNKIPITYVQGNYFYQAQQSLVQQYQSSITESNSQLMIYQIWREAFEMAVVRTAILDEMKRAGYKAPEDVVDREVALLPQFQINGRFSAAKYRELDNNSRLTLWRQTQDGIAVDRYVNDITGILVSSKESAFVSSMASPQRRFDMAAFPVSSYPDSEIAAYVRSNPAPFRVTHLSRITINSSEREARQILDSIREGTATFEEAARTNSQDGYSENGGDMGIRMAYELVSDITDESARESVIALARGNYSDIIAVAEKSWAFFRAEEDVHPADVNDAAAMEKIRNYVMAYERGRAEDWAIAEAEKFAAEVRERDFDSAIADRAMEKKSFGPIPVNYGDAAIFPAVSSSGVTELSTASTNENFWKIGFATPLNTPSEPLVIGNDVVVLFPLEETVQDTENDSFIEAYYPYWAGSSIESGIRTAFLNNGKLDDRFWNVFQYIWGSN